MPHKLQVIKKYLACWTDVIYMDGFLWLRVPLAIASAHEAEIALKQLNNKICYDAELHGKQIMTVFVCSRHIVNRKCCSVRESP